MSDLVLDVSLVVSGVNEGANLGDDTTYSSTVGAAVEGALLGVGSIAISQQSRDRRFRLVDHTDYDWSSAGTVLATLARAAAQSTIPARTVVNVNVPGTAPTAPSQSTQLGQRTYRRGGLEMAHTDLGHGFYSFHVNEETDPPFDPAPGTDFAAMVGGSVSLTPLSFSWGESGALKDAVQWIRQAAPLVDRALGL